MAPMSRRQLLKTGLGACALSSAPALGFKHGSQREENELMLGKEVKLRGDGLALSPEEYSRLLARLTESGAVEADYYSNGGAVEQMEKRFAEILGKERAVFFPTGTLANHVAVRELAGNDRRVIVQAESHVYNDSGDCIQTVSGLNLIPLAKGEATFSVEEVEGVLRRTSAGRVKTNVGVISIENPVRRKLGEVFDYEEMKKIATLARDQGIRMHLDGARLFIASAVTGIPIIDYSKLFDTVYISLYKYFNAASGAVLAGPAEMLDGIYHMRRMFGGGLPQVWPFAAVAAYFLDGFIERFSKAMTAFENLIQGLESKGFKIDRITNGTNICQLRWNKKVSKEDFRQRLLAKDVILSEPAAEFDGFILTGNETITRMETGRLVEFFVEASK